MTFAIIKNVRTGSIAALRCTAEQFEKFDAGEIGSPELNGWMIDNPEDIRQVGFTGITGAEFLRSNGEQAPQRFKTTEQLIARVFDALPNIARDFDLEDQGDVDATPVQAVTKTKKPAKKRVPGVVSHDPKDCAYPCRQGTKQSFLIDALAKGATMDQLRKATSLAKGGKVDWTDTSIRSALAYDVCTIKGYGVRTEMRGDTPVYHLVLPEGLEAPLPHTPRKTKAKADA